ncbi:Glyoxalase-like domain protein [Bacillus sp. THAF10]|uniref:VOC family protein n=1 Tax=Bacillus sp. THAF10 TaxID=2587848 RepID=UPI0012694BEA|nr:VOC family protein [Bacillus sp. THAF10]QFT87524.1 Glyoxalase-like domain protein [Bacillus sp. THAF10]
MFKRIDTVFLEVTNMEKSIRWYTEVLGFTVRWHDKENGYAAMEVGETPITLVKAAEVTPGKHCLLNFYAADIHGANHLLKERGVEVADVMDYGNVLSFEFKDPDGHILGVCYFEE